MQQLHQCHFVHCSSHSGLVAQLTKYYNVAIYFLFFYPLKVLTLLKEKPSMRSLLEMPGQGKDVTANVVAGLLKPSYSVLGSNRRPKEELIMVKFREFLQCVQGK